MRVAVVLAILLGFSLPSSNAYADACVDAARRQNAQVRKATSWYLSALKQTGIILKDIDDSNAQQCVKLLPIYKARIPLLEEGARLERELFRKCAPSRIDKEPGEKATKYISIAETIPMNQARVDRCERTLAAANSAPDARTAYGSSVGGTLAGSQQPASCSDITGTGGSAPAATHCKNADRSLYAARQMRKANPQIAATEYKKAAVAARSAGDTTLELSILREAADHDSAARSDSADSAANTNPKVAVVTPPRSAPPPATPLPLGQLWDGSYDTCNTAKELERTTAAWYYECVLSNQPKATNNLYRPNPDPAVLGKQARQACGSYSRDTQQCYADFKLNAILAQSPSMREACEKHASQQSQLRQPLFKQLGIADNTRQKFLECIDNAYLYGDVDGSPDKPKVSIRDRLRKEFERKKLADNKGTPEGRQELHACWAPGSCCPPGQGIKPTPGAFGAWSCQLLGGFLPNSKRLHAEEKEDSDRIEALEQRINAVALNSVAAAIAALGRTLSEAERATCEVASLAAAWSVLKGGVPYVPDKCRAMANATVGYLPFYADYHVDNTSDPMEDILANFRSDALTDAYSQQKTLDCSSPGGMFVCANNAPSTPPNGR